MTYQGAQFVLSDESKGRIVISYSADMSSHTTSAGGYVVVNKITAHAGTVALEMPQNSAGDLWLRDWCMTLKSVNVKKFALATLVITDNATGQTYTMTGVTPQKIPDISYDQAAGTVQYTLLCAYVTVSSSVESNFKIGY